MNTTLKTKKRRYRSLAEWESLIKDWHTRGLGRGEYCKIHGISYAVFSRWLRRIKGGASAHQVDFSPLASEPADKAPGTFPRKKEAGISSPFIPVYLSSEASPSYEGLKRSQVDVFLSNGHRVCIQGEVKWEAVGSFLENLLLKPCS